MTTAPRSLSTPSIGSQSMATTRTPRSGHGLDLSELTNDAASGHPGQRATALRIVSGTVVCVIHRDTIARYLRLDAVIAWRGTTPTRDGATISLTISDGTHSVSPPSTAIPYGWDGSVNFATVEGASRAASMASTARGVVDLEDAAFASFTTTVPWTLTFTVTADPTAWVEVLQVREVPRFLIDDIRSWGEVPGHYLARAPINARVSRWQASVHAAVDLYRRTHHHLAVIRTAAWTTTSAADAAIPGTLSESVGAAAKWKTHPRALDTFGPAVAFGSHYKTSGPTGGVLKLHSGAGSYSLTLPGTSGAWATVLTGAGFLAATDEDSLWWTASIAAGMLSLATLWVCNDP